MKSNREEKRLAYIKRFKLADSNQYKLDVEGALEGRFWHLATIHYGTREFMFYADLLADRLDPIGPPIKVYIEEITGGHLEVVRDKTLWEEINNYLIDIGINSDKMIHFMNAHRTRLLSQGV